MLLSRYFIKPTILFIPSNIFRARYSFVILFFPLNFFSNIIVIYSRHFQMLKIFHYCISNQDKSLFIFFYKYLKIVLFQPENYDVKYDELLTRYDLSRLLQRGGGASVVLTTDVIFFSDVTMTSLWSRVSVWKIIQCCNIKPLLLLCLHSTADRRRA